MKPRKSRNKLTNLTRIIYVSIFKKKFNNITKIDFIQREEIECTVSVGSYSSLYLNFFKNWLFIIHKMKYDRSNIENGEKNQKENLYYPLELSINYFVYYMFSFLKLILHISLMYFLIGLSFFLCQSLICLCNELIYSLLQLQYTERNYFHSFYSL